MSFISYLKRKERKKQETRNVSCARVDDASHVIPNS